MNLQVRGSGMLLMMVALLTQVDGQERPGRNVPRPALPYQLDPNYHRIDSVILKWVDEVPIRYDRRRQILNSRKVLPLEPYQWLLAGLQVQPLFTRPAGELEREREAILQDLPDHLPLPADLNHFLQIRSLGHEHSEWLVEALLQLPLTETAYAEPSPDSLRATGGDLAPTTGQFEHIQLYRGPAPSGLGYDAYRNIVGARGPDLVVGHLEGSWHFGLEDACQVLTANVIGPQPTPLWASFQDHGDAGAGILVADRNGFGMRGMNDAAQLVLATFQFGAANAISLCTAAAGLGDVLFSSFGWGIVGGTAPLDFYQAEFDAIYVATLAGITYCMSAGNSDQDLGDTNIYGTRYVPTSPDSGGVIVGAGNSFDLNKIDFSNYGARVDCHAWGANIPTLGYGDLFDPGDVRQRYTLNYGGTSGAAPLVAGIAAALSNIVREQNDVQLTALQIRDLLRVVGTPQGSGEPIGPRPDLELLLAAHGLPDGLQLQGDAQIGAQVSFEVSGEPLMPFLFFGSLSRGRADAGLNRAFLIDFGSFFLVSGFALDGAGQATVTAPIPSDAALHDLSVYLQVLDLRAAGLHLSNSVEMWIQ
jgi:hypothetical protein